MATKYIDLSAGANGTGTQASPYNGFAEFNALSGDQGGNVWLVKRGSSKATNIANSAASNYVLRAYGDADARPVINAAGHLEACAVGGDNVTVSQLHLTGAGADGILVDGTRTANNLKIIGCEIDTIDGGGGGSAEDAINCKPLTSTGVVIADNILHDCGGNAIEFGHLSGGLIIGNYGYRCVQCLEAWLGCTSTIAEYNRFEEMTGRAWWLSNVAGAGTETYTDNICRNNVFGGVAVGFVAEANATAMTGNQFYNNTLLVTKWGKAIDLNGGTAHIFKNNVVAFTHVGSTGVSNGVELTAGTEVGSAIDNNYYWFEEQALADNGSAGRIDKYSLPKYVMGATTYQTGNTADVNALRLWAAATGFDTHSWGGTAGGNPFLDYTAGLYFGADWSLKNGEVLHTAVKTQISTAAAAVESALTSIDQLRRARYVDNDPGGLQYQRHPSIVSAIAISR